MRLFRIRWPRRYRRRRYSNGEAILAGRLADEALRDAHNRLDRVNQVVKIAEDLTRAADRYTRDVERSWRPRRPL